MSNNEAKFLLNAYRPSGVDANDPAFAEALNQAKADPTLGAWFAHEQAHSAAVASKLREIQPPAGLRDAILAGGRLSKPTALPPVPRRRASSWMAIAASVAVLAGAGYLAVRTSDAQRSSTAQVGAPSVATLTNFAFADAADESTHGGHGALERELRQTLRRPSVHVEGDLPVDFAKLAETGCRTLRVANRDVLEVCFARNGLVFHLYVARAADFVGAPSGATEFLKQGQLTAATWTHGAMRYVVVAAAGIDAVKAIL